MEKSLGSSLESYVQSWNENFPDYQMTAADLKKPHSVIGALFQVFDQLYIDKDAILYEVPSEESRNEHAVYYRDLIPFINITRLVNHLIIVMPQLAVVYKLSQFLQPATVKSQTLLFLLCNLMVFNKGRLSFIAPLEEELLAWAGKVKHLEDVKNELLVKINEQAEQKGKRAQKLVKLASETKQIEEEIKEEEEASDAEKQQLEAIVKENQRTKMLVEQKKTCLNSLLEEVEKKRALRVYDAEDIKSQAEKAELNLQEAEEKLNSLKAIHMEKENCLKNLLVIKPSLDSAYNLLEEIMHLSNTLKDFELTDLDSESKEAELSVFNNELAEVQAELAELSNAREEASVKRKDNQAKRLQEKTLTQSALHEAEENDKKCRERSKMALRRIEEIKEQTFKYEEKKAKGLEELAHMKNNLCKEVKLVQNELFNKALEVEKRINDKLGKELS